MKRAVFTLWLLLAAVAATAQGNSPDFEFEYSDLQLSPDDYIGLQLPPLHQLLENARNTPQVEYYNKAVEIQERELKNVRRNWQHYFKINANYNYGSSDIYNQNYQDNSNQIWTTTTTGREQSWWNVGASFSLPIDEIFNRRNKIKHTDSFLMIPCKSITAVLGLSEKGTQCHVGKCMSCKLNKCPFRK